jgi:hypothetical protein
MFKHTWVVNACRTVGAAETSLLNANGGGSEIDVRVLHKVGELDVL